MANQLGFGGSCHWCTEAIFQSLRGVTSVEQGWIASRPPDDTPSEAVRVTFDPSVIDLETLICVHLYSHSSTSLHSMRNKYRSAVYVIDDQQTTQAQNAIAAIQPEFDQPIITRVLPLATFRLNDEQYLNYYASDPNRPFCRTIIEPKLAEIAERFEEIVHP